ncbi:MAG TPA: RtcB family protein [Polyangia bacterium]|nr:RtcB family protein [Polyangia bacterium]
MTEPLPPDVAAALQRLARADDVRRIAVMPDVHLAGDVCIGTVAATTRLVYPAAVGGDIGCGVAAAPFDCAATLLDDASVAAQLLGALYATVPTLQHSSARAPDLPSSLAASRLSHPSLARLATREGRRELGTLGRGNHFLELQADDEGRLWLMVHSGSRIMGKAIRDHHLRAAAVEDQRLGLLGLEHTSERGRAYLSDMQWAIDYAELNRRRMLASVGQIMRQRFGVTMMIDDIIGCDHNHARREHHDGVDYWVHRKGAIAAAVEAVGIIPGSMGTASFHTVGRGSSRALASSSHGAGRALPRGDARRQVSTRALLRQLDGVWFDHRRAEALREEAPAAYKDIGAVMRAQRELVRITRTLRPRLSFKGT